jgi:hypothetical protein
VHDLVAAAIGDADRHDEIDTAGDLSEIRRVQLGPGVQGRGGLPQVLNGHRLRYPSVTARDSGFHQHPHRDFGGIAGRDRVHGM